MREQATFALAQMTVAEQPELNLKKNGGADAGGAGALSGGAYSLSGNLHGGVFAR